MAQQSYASQIGQGPGIYGGGYQGQGGDRAMGGAMSMAGAVGAPLMSGAMGLLGLDPMSIGLKAGVGAFAGGAGLGGAALVGGAVAMPLMAAGAAANYAGGQMYQGAQNQLGLNQQLRQGFNFKNQYGGQGFQRSDMSSIGSMVHTMSEQFGPGGEIASFRELSGLAGKMGSMGFAQGVKDVQSFTTRFKEMVKSLKTMATDLGTTLEGAMEFAQAAKGSGVFGMPRVQAFSAAARSASVAGGLALSEVTGAASIGSQISRSMGGLGRQGANAGIKTIGQIGVAQQMGALSEEDIYNVTGLTGAEGRQAYAASSLQSSARFLQSSRGRRMVASMAGKDGSLDEGAVQQFMSGGMGIQETMQNDRSHLGAVGRANFIRNEGRLRGAVMEKFGAFLPAMQMQQWASSKGIDINNMDDRSMLFAQRQLGMGRDEVDQAVKMASQMPRIMNEMQRSDRDDHYFQALATGRKGQGVEGVKQRFEQAKAEINGKLQKVGQDIFNSGSEAIDGFFNKLFGTMVETQHKDIDAQYHAVLRGGASGTATASKVFGLGASTLRKDFDAFGGRGTGGLLGAPVQDLARAMGVGSTAGSFTDALAADYKNKDRLGGGATGFLANGESLKYLFQGQSGAGKLKDLGIDIKGMSSQQIQAKLLQAQAIQAAAATGFDTAAVKAAGANGADFLSTAYAMGRVEGKGPERMANIEDVIRKQAAGNALDKNTVAAKAMLQQLEGKSPEQKAALIGNYERAQKIDVAAQLGALSGLGEGGLTGLMAREGAMHGFGNVGEESKAFAEAMGITDKSSTAQKVAGATISGLATTLLGPVASLFSTKTLNDFGQDVAGRISGSGARQRAAGDYVKGEEFRDTVTGLFSADKDESASARTALMRSIQSQVNHETGKTEVQRNLLAGRDYLDFMKPGPDGKPPSEEEQERWAKEKGTTLDSVKAALGGAKQVLEADRAKARAAEDKRIRMDSGENITTLSAIGVIGDDGKLSAASVKALTVKGSDKARKYVESVIDQETRNVSGGIDAYSAEKTASRASSLEGMSVEEKRAAASTLGGSLGAEAGYQASIEQRLNKGRKGRASAVAGILGLEIDPAELKRLGGNNDEIAKYYANKMGAAGDKGVTEDLVKALTGKGGGAAGALSRIAQNPEVEKHRQAENEKKQEADNPLMAAIKANTQKTAAALERLTAGAIGDAVGSAVNAKINPENGGGGKKGP